MWVGAEGMCHVLRIDGIVLLGQVMGIAIFSPRLDVHGNSVRGIEFCKRLLAKYPFGIFDSIVLPKGVKPTALLAGEGTRCRKLIDGY